MSSSYFKKAGLPFSFSNVNSGSGEEESLIMETQEQETKGKKHLNKDDL